jgi:hypothetical protein
VELEGAVVLLPGEVAEVVELVLLLVDPDKLPENCVMSEQGQSRAERAPHTTQLLLQLLG